MLTPTTRTRKIEHPTDPTFAGTEQGVTFAEGSALTNDAEAIDWFRRNGWKVDHTIHAGPHPRVDAKVVGGQLHDALGGEA